MVGAAHNPFLLSKLKIVMMLNSTQNEHHQYRREGVEQGEDRLHQFQQACVINVLLDKHTLWPILRLASTFNLVP